MKKRIAALLLAAMMVLPLAACADDTGVTPPANDTTAPTDTTAAPDESTIPPETGPTPNLPDVGDKYKGTEFVIAHRGIGHTHYNEPWVYADAINGDTINDAVYKRNSYIEEKYGISIVEHLDDNPMNAVELASNSQDDLYDIAFPYVNKVSSPILQGMMYDLNELEYIDFDQPWWDSNLVDAVSFGGKLFVGVSDINLSVGTRCRGMTFNRDLVRKYELEDPYELVKNNEWTLDRMITMIQKCSDDLDGDSQWTDADRYGMLTEEGGGNGNVNNFVIGAGITIYEKSADDEIAVTFLNERTINVLELCRTFLLDKTITRDFDDLTPDNDDEFTYGRSILFANDHFLFTQCSPRSFNDLVTGNMESEYGIVPNPKLNAEQERYYNRPDRNAAIMIVPSTNQEDDLERLSIIIEDMAYMSSKTVLPDYYETVIKLRRARVPELGEMVDIIKNSVYYDINFIFTISYTDALDQAFKSGNFASTFSRYQRIIENSVKQMVKKLDALK